MGHDYPSPVQARGEQLPSAGCLGPVGGRNLEGPPKAILWGPG